MQRIKNCIKKWLKMLRVSLRRGPQPMRRCGSSVNTWNLVANILKDGKIIVCGDSNKVTKACRPIVRVNNDTAITIQQLLELHSVEDIVKAAEKKNKDMDGRLMWKELKFIPSK